MSADLSDKVQASSESLSALENPRAQPQSSEESTMMVALQVEPKTVEEAQETQSIVDQAKESKAPESETGMLQHEPRELPAPSIHLEPVDRSRAVPQRPPPADQTRRHHAHPQHAGLREGDNRHGLQSYLNPAAPTFDAARSNFDAATGSTLAPYDFDLSRSIWYAPQAVPLPYLHTMPGPSQTATQRSQVPITYPNPPQRPHTRALNRHPPPGLTDPFLPNSTRLSTTAARTAGHRARSKAPARRRRTLPPKTREQIRQSREKLEATIGFEDADDTEWIPEIKH
jgi:hypothetical protein